MEVTTGAGGGEHVCGGRAGPAHTGSGWHLQGLTTRNRRLFTPERGPDAEALEADAQLVSALAPLPQGTEGVPFLSGLTAGTSVSIAVTTAWS